MPNTRSAPVQPDKVNEVWLLAARLTTIRREKPDAYMRLLEALATVEPAPTGDRP